MKKTSYLFLVFISFLHPIFCQSLSPGISPNLSNLYMLSNAKTRSISAENLTGENGKGAMAVKGTGEYGARELGEGWKVNPAIYIQPNSTHTLAEIEGPGAIQQIWMTTNGDCRQQILRIYWDDEQAPSVEVPLGDFFAIGWGEYRQISSLAVCVNSGKAFNCYWVMPFRKKCKITLENLNDKLYVLFYQINYALDEVPEKAAYFHAQFRRVNPLPYKEVYTIVDDIKGKGQYVGTYVAWQSNTNGWWGEGEIKFYMDGDKKYPTIVGTGTEDYFCGAYCFTADLGNGKTGYKEYTTPYTGFHVFRPDGEGKSQTRFSMYRWHITDPIRFDENLKITMQALGWHNDRRYKPLTDDIASTAFWYQEEPHQKFPKFPARDELEVIN